MASEDYKQIPIRVTEETKQRWEAEIVDNPAIPHNSMAAAIRNAMEETYFSNTTDSPELNVDLRPLEDKLDETLARMGEMQKQLNQVERRTSDIRPVEIVDNVRNLLKKVDSPEELPPLTRAAGTPNDAERLGNMGTIEEFAEFFGIEIEVMEQAFEMLEADGEVTYIEDNGHKRYYRQTEGEE